MAPWLVNYNQDNLEWGSQVLTIAQITLKIIFQDKESQWDSKIKEVETLVLIRYIDSLRWCSNDR